MNARKIPDIDVKWLRSYFLEIKSVFSRIDLIKILEDLKEQKVLGRSFKYGRFVDLITTDLPILETVKVDLPNDVKTERYVLIDFTVHPFEIALSLNPVAYVSYYSALFISIESKLLNLEILKIK